MDDPLDVEREELLVLLEQLERLCAGLQDVNAGVSPRRCDVLCRLRDEVKSSESPSKLLEVRKVALDILKAVAAAVVTKWIETLICNLTAARLRILIYDVRRVHTIAPGFSWSQAA